MKALTPVLKWFIYAWFLNQLTVARAIGKQVVYKQGKILRLIDIIWGADPSKLYETSMELIYKHN
jgi:hypothetical protein